MLSLTNPATMGGPNTKHERVERDRSEGLRQQVGLSDQDIERSRFAGPRHPIS